MSHRLSPVRQLITMGLGVLCMLSGVLSTRLSAQDNSIDPDLTISHRRSAVRSIAYSPDGSLIASGGQDNTLRIWNASNGHQVFSLKGHTHTITVVKFSVHGKWIASGSSDRTVRIWDVETGQQFRLLTANQSDVRDIAFSPNGTRIASVGVDDRTLHVWNIFSDQEAFSITGPREWQGLESVAFSPDDKWLALGTYNGTVQICDATTGEQRRTIAKDMGVIRGLDFSPDSAQLAVSGAAITVWDVVADKQIAKFDIPGMRFDVTFSPDGQRIAACTSDAYLAEWDVASQRQTISLDVPHLDHLGFVSKGINYVYEVAYSPNGQQLAACSSDGEIRIWDLPLR
ncbi:MAG: WD40 repeat domain-containing protein [Planctomycetaceae bacterium]|nr:WD40 repeat domain-containing protein [Planctomycetaceae bacterium]MCB9949646.1 WD40 repeat domain-containing protein [Planctomycetaceae bacterium]